MNKRSDYPKDLKLNYTNIYDSKGPFLDLYLLSSNDIISARIYANQDETDFDIVNFLFVDRDLSCATSHSVYISQLINFARISSQVSHFNDGNNILMAKQQF